MKRSPMPPRKKPMGRGQSRLSSSKPLNRNGRIKQVSKKRAVVNRRRRKVIEALCEELIAEYGYVPCACGCGQEATDPHEPLTRARGGAIDDPNNILPLTRSCHTDVHLNPDEAEKRGLLIHSWNKEKAP